MSRSLFEVDKKGLSKLLERRGKGFAVVELIQNSWDEAVTRVEIDLKPIPSSARALLMVTDDAPEGFADLSDAWTLFKDSGSGKRYDPTKRGRFNLGEKLVIALCDEAEIATTTGTVTFGPDGRKRLRRKTEQGSMFTGMIRMTRAEYAEVEQMIRTLLPPVGVETIFNDEALPVRSPLRSFKTSLPTEVADSEGYLRSATRTTTVHVYAPLNGETGTLYEMGIPVVATGDRFHVSVEQKIPLNLDRDNVSPSYLRQVRALVLNETHGLLAGTEAGASWIDQALESSHVSREATEAAMRLRFGDKRVIHDPSDPEANKLAVVKGYTVVPGRALSKQAWVNVRTHGALRPAGQVTPSPKPFHPDGAPLKLLPPEEWTDDIHNIINLSKALGLLWTGRYPRTIIANDPGWNFQAAYGRSDGLVLNYSKLGAGWFAHGPNENVLDLLIHEFAHEFESDHLSARYYRALSQLGAKLAVAIHENSQFLDPFDPDLR